MASRPVVRVKVSPKFPAQVIGGDGITVTLANGIYTIALTSAAAEAIDDVESLIDAVFGSLRVVTASGTVTVSQTEVGVAINKTVGAATTVQLPAAALRNGVAVIVKDMKKDANTNNITVLPTASETIDGNAQDIINTNAGSRGYRPISGVGWLRT